MYFNFLLNQTKYNSTILAELHLLVILYFHRSLSMNSISDRNFNLTNIGSKLAPKFISFKLQQAYR